MTPDRWQQIQTLFDAALEQPREARTAFLDSACRDEALRQEVVALLETYEEDPDFLEDPAASLPCGSGNRERSRIEAWDERE